MGELLKKKIVKGLGAQLVVNVLSKGCKTLQNLQLEAFLRN